MIRLTALFLAVGFVWVAVFLMVPDDVPGPLARASLNGPPAAAGFAPNVEAAGPRANRAATGPHSIDPRRFDEAVPKEQLFLDVVREDGRPLADAALRFATEGVVVETVTDANGRAHVDAQPEASAFLTVTRADFYPHTGVIALEPGRRRIVVPNRKTVVAHVFVRNETPREPIRIGYQLPFNLIALTAMSDAEGRVEFFNIPTTVEGTFTWPEGYRREEENWGFFTAFAPDSNKPTAHYATKEMTEAEWTNAVAAAETAATNNLSKDSSDKPTWTNVNWKLSAETIRFAGSLDVQVQLAQPAITSNRVGRDPAVPAADHPEGGPALVPEMILQGNAETLGKVLEKHRLISVEAAVTLAQRQVNEIPEERRLANEPQGDIPIVTMLTWPNEGQKDGAGNSNEVFRYVARATLAGVTEIRLIPTRTIPIRMLDPSGSPVAAVVQVNQGWCVFNQLPTGATLVLDEDVYAAGLSSVISVSMPQTGTALPIENVSMTWNAAGAPSATVNVGYPPDPAEPAAGVPVCTR